VRPLKLSKTAATQKHITKLHLWAGKKMLGKMINLVSVCTDNYSMVYANKLYRQFSNLTTLEVSHCFLTDRPSELLEFIKPIAPFKKSKGW
jgi:hypothetical protein